jgi:ketosteroid isomerase-like protein
MQPTATGTAGITAGLKGLFDQYTISDVTISPLKTDVEGTLAYDIGTFRFTGVPKARGDTLKSEGRYTVILRKQTDGTWRIISDMDNTAAPLMPPAPPGKK